MYYLRIRLAHLDRFRIRGVEPHSMDGQVSWEIQEISAGGP